MPGVAGHSASISLEQSLLLAQAERVRTNPAPRLADAIVTG
ncbi:MAG: hypothetical protein AAFQ95_02310 [Cyanobacteria bacterium J06621_3]